MQPVLQTTSKTHSGRVLRSILCIWSLIPISSMQPVSSSGTSAAYCSTIRSRPGGMTAGPRMSLNAIVTSAAMLARMYQRDAFCTDSAPADTSANASICSAQLFCAARLSSSPPDTAK